MNMAGITSGVVGMALFDLWDAGVKKSLRAKQHARYAQACPLVATACDAFEAYLRTAEIGMAAQIAGIATYALQPRGNCVSLVTTQQLAPFMALNILA
jgi:hypothetical protein